MIYELLFKPGAKHKCEYPMTPFNKPKLNSQLLACRKDIRNEAEAMLYDRTFRIDDDLPRFIRRAGRRKDLLRHVEFEQMYICKARIREVKRLTNLETLTVAFDRMDHIEPAADKNGSYLPWGDKFIADVRQLRVLQDMIRDRPQVVYYLKSCIRTRLSGSTSLHCRGWRLRVAYDFDQDAVKALEYEDWEETLELQVLRSAAY